MDNGSSNLYIPFENGDFLDLSSILNFLNNDEISAVQSPTPSSSPSTAASSWSPEADSLPCPTTQWKSLEEEVSLTLNDVYSSPFDSLDHVRNTGRYDFQTNGRDVEMDEFDLYQAHLRSSPAHGSKLTPLFPVNFASTMPKDQDSRRKKKAKSVKNTVCVFCKNNDEPLSVYGDHLLKDGTGKVTCPILRRYTCPICGSGGDNAHTIKYCPLNVNVDGGLRTLFRGRTARHS